MDAEIPEDIRQKASDVEQTCVVATWNLATVEERRDECERIIARALVAERERAAKIAENHDAWPQEGADIAAAIRDQSETARAELAKQAQELDMGY